MSSYSKLISGDYYKAADHRDVIHFSLSGLATGSAQQVTIKGIVKFVEDSTALPGVNVLIKGTKQGTSTDNNGEFELQIANTSQKTVTLVFAFIGFQN